LQVLQYQMQSIRPGTPLVLGRCHPIRIRVQSHGYFKSGDAFGRAPSSHVCRAAGPQESATAARSPVLNLLVEAASQRKVPAVDVEAALLQLEQDVATSSSGAQSVPGRWRLLFSTASKIRAFQYIPVKEDLVIDVGSNNVALESVLGPFQFFIRGTIFSWAADTGVLSFQFNKGVAIHFLGKQVTEIASKGSRKEYTFYFANDRIAAARSSAGGVSLLSRLPDL